MVGNFCAKLSKDEEIEAGTGRGGGVGQSNLERDESDTCCAKYVWCSCECSGPESETENGELLELLSMPLLEDLQSLPCPSP